MQLAIQHAEEVGQFRVPPTDPGSSADEAALKSAPLLALRAVRRAIAENPDHPLSLHLFLPFISGGRLCRNHGDGYGNPATDVHGNDLARNHGATPGTDALSMARWFGAGNDDNRRDYPGCNHDRTREHGDRHRGGPTGSVRLCHQTV